MRVGQYSDLPTACAVEGSNPCVGEVFRTRQIGPGAQPASCKIGIGTLY
jgi:hypothetical protein